jgi:hypothetical protein
LGLETPWLGVPTFIHGEWKKLLLKEMKKALAFLTFGIYPEYHPGLAKFGGIGKIE